MSGKSTWSDEQKATIRALWPDHSASIIGAQLGKTRCSIIGMARRLGLARKAKYENLAEIVPLRQKRPPMANSVAMEPPPEAPRRRPVGRPVSLLDAKDFQCKAILEGQKDENGLAMVCGQRISDGQPYSFCAYHLSLYVNKGRSQCQPPIW